MGGYEGEIDARGIGRVTPVKIRWGAVISNQEIVVGESVEKVIAYRAGEATAPGGIVAVEVSSNKDSIKGCNRSEKVIKVSAIERRVWGPIDRGNK